MVESELIECRVGNVHITPEQIGDVNIGTYGSEDYVLSTGNQIKAELITNNTVRVFDGVMVYGGLRDAVPVNKYYDITIDNGSQGKNRNDIIVRRYTKDDDSEKKARAVFTVVKGTPTDGTAVDPEITATDIRAGALSHDMKLHRVRLEGLNIVAVEPLFDVLMPMSEQQDMLSELNRKTIAEYDTLWTNAVIMRQGSRRTINFHHADIASKITLPEKDRPYHDRGACASVYNGGSVAVLIVRKNGEIAVSNQYGTIASGGIYGQIEYDV